MLRVALAAAAIAAPTPDDAACSRVSYCNGDMCKQICQIGSVDVDPLVEAALLFQRNLQVGEELKR